MVRMKAFIMQKERSIMMKKIFSVVVSVVVLLAVFSGAAFAQTVIKYANWQFQEPGRSDVLDEFIAAFEKETGVKVEKVSIPYSSYNDALATQFEAGSGPDVLFIQDLALVPWMKKGYLAELDALLDIKKYEEEFPVQQAFASMDGKNFAMIYEGFPYAGMIYNKEFLEKAGVDVPTTPEELIAVSDAIFKATGQPGLIHPTDLSNASYIMQGGMIVIHGFGGAIVDADGKFTVNAPEFIKGVDYLREIYNLKSTPAGMQFGVQRQQFLAGDAGIVMDGSYWPSIVQMNNPELYEKIGVAKLPFPNPASPFETNWYAVSENSKNKEAAAKFIDFLFRAENANRWAIISSIPGLKATYDAVINEYPWFQVYAEASPHGIVRMLPGHEADTPEINKMVADAIASAMSGQMTPENSMNQLQKNLEGRFGGGK
jgi:multiple sugar transport system substrate-binding protein